MKMPLENLHVGLRKQHRTLFIGRLINVDGKLKWKTTSSDRTNEMIETVMEKMYLDVRSENNPDKPFSGYRKEGVGTLLFIADGYTFSIRPEAKKKSLNGK